jgi:hypothetical protein
MTTYNERLSTQLDEARTMEEHYRALLIFWKQRRQRLESEILIDDPFSDFLKELLNEPHNHRLSTDTP